MRIYKGLTISSCIEQCAKIVKEKLNNNKKVLVFSEDRITLSLELEICKVLGGCFMNVEVLTFKNYIASRLNDISMLSQESSCMVVRKLIAENSKDLVCFKNVKTCPNLSNTVYELISLLESAKVRSCELDKLINSGSCNLNLALVNKLKDICLIYSKYEEYLKEKNLFDSNDYLSLMPELIQEDTKLHNSAVICVGFSSATRQRVDIFKTLIKYADSFDGVVVANENSTVYTNETLNRLRINDVKCEEFDIQNNLSKDGKIIAEYLFNPSLYKKSFVKYDTNNIKLYEAQNPDEEIEFVAKTILKQIKNSNLRYKDIVVAVGNLETYKIKIENIFLEYNIPFYIDKSISLKQHPLVSLISNLLDLVKKNLDVKDFIKFISNIFIINDKQVLDEFVNYITKNSFTRSQIKNEFTVECEKLSIFEDIRKKVIEIYEKFKIADSVNDYIESIKYTFQVFDVERNLSICSEKLQEYSETYYLSFNEKALDSLSKLLLEMQNILGNSRISLLDFKNVFLSGAEANTVGSIPLFNDAVYISECKDVKMKQANILFAIGLNGDVPFTKSDTALLSDGDLTKLDGFKIVVEPKIKVVNNRERENILTALLTFKDMLYLSYVNLSFDGKKSIKSQVVTDIEKMFNIQPITEFNQKETQNNSYEEYIANKFISTKSSQKEIARVKDKFNERDKEAEQIVSSYYTAISLDEKLTATTNKILNDSEEIQNINYGYLPLKNNEISATVLEKYFSCPYANYAQNILKLKDSEDGEMRVYELGTLIHDLLENYIKRIDEVTDKDTSNKLCLEIIDNIYNKDEYLKFLNKASYKVSFDLLKKEGLRACYVLYKGLKNSKFKPYLIEAEFNEKSKFKPIKITTKNGEYFVKGKVDRIDKYENNIRIIDYKSGKVEEQDEMFYTGNKLQLYLYMNAFLIDGLNPAGAYYFPIKDKFSNSKNSDDLINYQMLGKTVSNNEIINATDTSLTAGDSSKLTKITINKDGSVKKAPSVISVEDMQSYLKYAKLISQKGIEEIKEGFIKATPYKDKCKYCNYNGMCKFNKDYNDERKVEDVKPQTIIDATNNI